MIKLYGITGKRLRILPKLKHPFHILMGDGIFTFVQLNSMLTILIKKPLRAITKQAQQQSNFLLIYRLYAVISDYGCDSAPGSAVCTCSSFCLDEKMNKRNTTRIQSHSQTLSE